MLCKRPVTLLLVKVFFTQSLMELFYFVIFLFEFFLIWVPSHYFISKELVDSFSLKIFLGLMSSLRVVNPDGRSATLNLLSIDVETILCGFSFRADIFALASELTFL